MHNSTDKSVLHQVLLKCAVCHSFGLPIKICSNGELVCDKCEPRSVIYPTIEVPAFEALLKKKVFQCTYKEYGCEESFFYDFINTHQAQCMYRPQACMVKDCDWDGLSVDLHKHFNAKHKTRIRFNHIQLPVFREEKAEDLILAAMENAIFIIQFNYEPGKNLQYSISFISPYIKTATYAIYKDDKILKDGKCVYFDIDNYHQLLEEDVRECILTIKLTPIRYDSYVIDYGLIETQKCLKCMGYLIPFPHNLQPFGTVCGHCIGKGSDFAIAAADSLTEYNKTANFPCRWKFCNFVGNSLIMFRHERTCRFRLYSCLIDEHCDFMDSTEMKHHLMTTHSITYFKDKYIMNKPAKKRLFTIKNNEFVLVNVDILEQLTIHVTVKSSSSRNRSPIYVQYEHDHCNIKSRLFCVINEVNITREQLPPCYTQCKAFSVAFK